MLCFKLGSGMAINRTYGKLEFRKGTGSKSNPGGEWRITEAQPHVCIKLKSIFEKIPKYDTVPFSFPDSPEVCTDLSWFITRYPFDISEIDAKRLRNGTKSYHSSINDLESILLPSYIYHDNYVLNEGFSARHYQSIGVDLFMKCNRLLIGDDLGLGKAQPLYSKIATPTGWILMKDIQRGTKIFGADGKIYEVSGIYPQGIRPVYRITFNDGTTADCDGEHIWCVRDDNRRIRGKGWTTKTTTQLLSQGITKKLTANELIIGKNPLPKWEIPLVNPVEFSEKSYIIHPYILGLLIGDGYLAGETVCISIPDTKIETVDRINNLLPDSLKLRENRYPACPQYYITQKNGKARSGNPFKRELERLKLRVKSKLKFIPEEYLQGSIEQRKELLKGLMDTDGSIIKKRVTFHTCSQNLTIGITELVQSLGGMCKIRIYDRTHENKGIEYHVNIRTKFCPFKINVKTEQWKTKTGPIASKYIKGINLIGNTEQQCISVTSPDNLYVTDNYIVTHNTVIGILSFLRQGTLPAAVVVQAHLPTQWIDQIAKFTKLNVHYIKGTKPYSLPKADVYIFKYTCLSGWADVFATGMFKTVCFDEVQELRTGPGTNKYGGAQALSNNAERCMMLSATPIYNYADEIFNILNLMKPGCLGTRDQFVREWGSEVFRNGKSKFICKDPAALGTYLRQNFLFLRRTRQDVGMELPPINKITHVIDYDEYEMEKDLQLAKTLAIRVFHGSFTEAGQAARELSSLVRHATGVAKAKYVCEYVKILLDNNIPVVLVGWHRQVYKIWAKELEDYKPVFYTGHESGPQKTESFRKFTAGETNLFILSLRSGAGIDGLQFRCHYIVYGELDFSPKIHDQVTARIDRPGQDTQVTAIYLTSNAGSDPLMIETLGLKSSQMHGVIDPLLAPADQFTDESKIKRLAASYFKDKGISEKDIIDAGVNIPLSSCCGSIILTPGYCNTCELPCEILKEPVST